MRVPDTTASPAPQLCGKQCNPAHPCWHPARRPQGLTAVGVNVQSSSQAHLQLLGFPRLLLGLGKSLTGTRGQICCAGMLGGGEGEGGRDLGPTA